MFNQPRLLKPILAKVWFLGLQSKVCALGLQRASVGFISNCAHQGILRKIRRLEELCSFHLHEILRAIKSYRLQSILTTLTLTGAFCCWCDGIPF